MRGQLAYVAMQYVISNAKTISARIFDDEVVVANFASGIYYSLLDSAFDVWNGLMAGLSPEQIAQQLHVDSSEREAFLENIKQFVQALETEGLISPSAATVDSTWRPRKLQKLTAPKFEKFTDMQELLLLDPVHDVSDAGWPHENPDKKV